MPACTSLLKEETNCPIFLLVSVARFVLFTFRPPHVYCLSIVLALVPRRVSSSLSVLGLLRPLCYLSVREVGRSLSLSFPLFPSF